MRLVSSILLLSLLAACGDDDPSGGNEQEVITTVILSFTPAAGGTPRVFEFDDPDGDGGAAPTADTINLTHLEAYTFTVRFENRLETPAEDITAEVADEAEEHQVFFTGSATASALPMETEDADANGLPIGLRGSVVASGGAGDLVVTLRHLPPLNGVPTKTGGATEAGEVDARVTFPVAIPVP